MKDDRLSVKILTEILLICLLLAATACGVEEQEDDISRNSVKIYGIERELTLGLSEEVLADCFVTDQKLYYKEKKNGVNRLMMRELAAQTKPVQLFFLEENEVLHAFTVTEQGDIIMAVNRFGLSDDNEVDWNSRAVMELRKTDETGALLWK